MKILENKKGIALVTVYIVIVVIMGVLAIFTSRSINDFRIAHREKDTLRAYYAAEAGLSTIGIDIYNAFKASNEWASNKNSLAFRLWFGYPDSEPGWDAAQRRARFISNYPGFPITGMIDNCQYTVILPSDTADPIVPTDDGVLVKLIAVGRAPHFGGTVTKVIARTIFYGMKPSPIFNYAYFINNYGWLWGGGITVNGDVRSNGNFSLNGNPRINGDIYASENPDLGTVGTISGGNRNWDIPAYINHATNSMRPTNPTDPSNPSGTAYPAGYDGESERFQYQEVLEMPYLGNLTTYKQLAQLKNGQIIQGGNIIVNNVYNGNGPDGVAGTPDDGSIVLIGTADNPIEINGPVVADGDVIIRGVVSGQGTIYAARNMHIIGDITYQNPPSWSHPDADPASTVILNSTADFIGLACKGNVIIGDYTRNDWLNTCGNYLRPPFTQGYGTDTSDAVIGYDSDNDPSNGYWFNGDYTVPDGGNKDNGEGSLIDRRYYESSLSNDIISSIASPSNQIRNIDGIIYTNHAFAGRVGSFTINGTIVARDEAIIYSGNIDMNYDIRAHGDGIENTDIYLPRDLSLPENKVLQS